MEPLTGFWLWVVCFMAPGPAMVLNAAGLADLPWTPMVLGLLFHVVCVAALRRE